MKLPSFQFYPGDWLKDPNLRRCTHSAKGVWMDLLCLMFESEERGVLATAGRVWSDEEIAQAVGGDPSVVLACVQELTLKGVANRQSNGALYSKRLVRDEHKRKLCTEAGKRGGNPNLSPTLNRQSKGAAKGGSKRNLTPSSSSSSSTSVIEIPKALEAVEGFEKTYADYLASRKSKLSPHGQRLQLEMLAERPKDAVAVLEATIRNGYTGIRWEYIDRNQGSVPAKAVWAWPRVPGEFANRILADKGKQPVQTWGEITTALQFEIQEAWDNR